jgi:WD40-like Beta Propeller Repeat
MKASHDCFAPTRAKPASNPQHPTRRVWLAQSSVLLAAASLSACGGGGGGSDGGGGGGGGGGGPAGLIVAKSSAELSVYNAGSRSLTAYPASSTNIRVGVGASRAGVVGDVANYNGGDTWEVVLLNAKTGADIRRIAINRASAFPSSAVTVNPDATRIAFSVNEPNSATDTTRVERTLVVDLASLNAARLNGATDPVYAGNELIVRVGTQLRVFNTNLDDQGELGVAVADRIGSASASSDGRYVAYERDEQIWVVDRTTRQTWAATSAVLRKFAPAFSPDGRHLAMLGGGNTAGVYVHVIAYAPGATAAVSDAQVVESAAGVRVAGTGRIVWIDA